MPASIRIAPARSTADLRAAAAVTSRSYKGKPPGFLRYLRAVGRENVLLAREGRIAAGALAILPVGVWLGGRSVPSAGIACVATAPERRGSGIAPALMGECVRLLARRGFAVSTLFPSTLGLYRDAGYELAGLWHQWRIPTAEFVFRDRELAIRRATASDLRAIRRLHSGWARRQPGVLERGDWWWKRVLSREDEPREAHVVVNRGRVEGYLVGFLEPSAGGRLDVRGLGAALTGYLSPGDLALAGLVEGPEADLEALAAMFAGPAPYTTDGF